MKTNEIIAGLRKLCGQGSEYRRTVCRLAADTLETQQKRIEELEKERRWIPVTERLPESGVRVIVCRGDKVEQGVFRGVNGWWKVYGTNTKKVTHWMPLPEPPKEGMT